MLSWKPVMMLVLIAMTTVMTKISAYVRTNTQNEDVALDSCGQLDIAFIIDSSGSINDADPSNWRTLLQFMADLINGGAFMVGQDGVRFAVVKYSTTAYVEFSLDAYNDNSSLTERILASKYIGGRTNIAAALEMTRTSVFRQQNGDRNHVPNVAILVTDGIPNEQEQDTLMEANLLKANNTDHETLVITVGITDAVDVDQLKNISTNNQILYVSNFTRLNLLIDTISTATCKARTITVEYCTNPVDLIFIVDSSGSVGQSNWPQVLNFCSLVVNKLKTTKKDDVRVGMLSYGNSAYRQFDLNSYTTKEAIMDNIRNITYKNEMTNTSGAIRYATDIMFKAASGDRPGVTNVAIVITDGEANRDANLTTPEAIRARSKGIHVIAIGIGEQIGNKELRGIGGDNVYRVRGFDVMADITDAIVDETCDLTAACTAKNDVLFVLDSSGSVSFDNFETMKNSVAGAVQSMVSENGTRVGIVTFSTTATVHMYTDHYGNGTEQADAIRRIQYLPGTTNTAEALRTARDVVFGGNRDRHDVRDILVLLTDGGSNDFAATLHESVLTKLAGIHVIVVGVTSWVNAAEVNAIATSPVGKNAIMAKDFDVINASMMKVRKLICSDIDPCTTSFCQNGGTCKQRAGEAICLCTPGHAGDRCQYGCSERADVVIMIDSSSSVTSRRYYEMLEVVRQLVKQLPMYRDMVRTAVITFSSQAKLRLTMRDMKNKTAVEESIMFSYIGGTTNTAAALNMMQDDVFDVPSDRPYIRNVALLLTDGQSNDRSATFAAAARCHHQGTHIIAAGINMMTQYQQRELRSIASDPDTSSLVNIASFEELRDKGKDIILPAFLEAVCNNIDECETSRCENGATCVDGIFSHDCICPKGYSGRYCEKRCSDKLDIVFAVDVSGSIRRSRLEIIKYFISMIILDFDVSDRHTRIGLLTFSDTAHVVSHLNTYTSKEDIMQAVDLLPYTMGRTNIADALVTMRNMFSELHGDRLDAPDIGVIITDGIPTVNLDKTVPEAIQNRLLGIHLMVVVAESDPEYLLFKGIATDPDERNIFSAPKFGDLMVLHESVRKAMCNDVDECLSNPCQNGGKCIDLLGRRVCLCPDQYTGENCERTCRRRYDVTFVLDASGSPNKNFEHAQRLAKQVVLGLNFNGGRTRVAMVTYGDVATVRFRLDAYTSQLEVLNAIAFDDEKGRTNTASGLRAAETQVLVTGNGDRAGDANIVIVATDGYSNLDPEQTRQEAAAITRGGSRIIVVAVGSNVNHKEINNIASDPDTENVVLMPDPDSVMSAADAVLRLLCD